MSENFILNTPDVSFYSNSMRKCGYDNYEALCEFSDNSIEKYVEGTFCNFSFIKSEDGRQIEKIIVSDDGKGIEERIADSFFNFGVSTKDASCYGGYGLGAKTAALSMGRRITLYTKQNNAPIFKYVFDLDVIQEKKTPLTLKEGEETLTQDEVSFFFDNIKNTNNGTVIIVDKLDALTCKTPAMFKATLNNRLRKNYSYILTENKNISITIEGEKIKPLSYVGGIDKNGEAFNGVLLDRITTTYKGCPITIETYFLNTKIGVIDSQNYDIPANQKNCGLYFFRNGRLVGSGLKPEGVISKGEIGGDGHSSHFRGLVYYSGEMDNFINLATFNKMINDKKELNEDFRNFLHKHINPSYRTYTKLNKIRINENNTQRNKEKAAELTKRVKNFINDHKVRLANNHAKNNRNDNESKPTVKNTTTNSRKRERSLHNIYECANWFGEVMYSNNLSPQDRLYQTVYDNGKYNFIINTNNPSYAPFWERFDDDLELLFIIYTCTYDISIMKADIEDESRDILLNNLEIIEECHNNLLHKFFKNFEQKIDNRPINVTVNKQSELEFVSTV